jgi:hypothetical protein
MVLADKKKFEAQRLMRFDKIALQNKSVAAA